MSDVFKIINATKEEACRAAEAEAIRAKTGETDPLTYDFANGKGFADAIAEITSGIPLPSVISKLDGGSFTLVNDTLVESHTIPHTLGELPKGFVLWAVNNTKETYSRSTALGASITLADIESPYVAFWNEFHRKTDGTRYGTSNFLKDTLLSSWATSNIIAANVANCYYKAGCTYKWIAWA